MGRKKSYEIHIADDAWIACLVDIKSLEDITNYNEVFGTPLVGFNPEELAEAYLSERLWKEVDRKLYNNGTCLIVEAEIDTSLKPYTKSRQHHFISISHAPFVVWK